MTSGWSIRPARAEDEGFLWTMLFYASHSNDCPGVGPADIMDNPDLVGYIEGWKLAGLPGVIAEKDGDPIGAAWLRLLPKSEESNPVFVRGDIPELAVAVLPGREGKGIGTAMIQSLLTEIRGRFVSVVLSARADNPAVGLYRRLGFRSLGEITNRVGTRSVKMIVDL
ncbi:MAG TPA: GNAT family N-acetyltransferase [Acidimicrobiia bacterium]